MPTKQAKQARKLDKKTPSQTQQVLQPPAQRHTSDFNDEAGSRWASWRIFKIPAKTHLRTSGVAFSELIDENSSSATTLSNEATATAVHKTMECARNFRDSN